jgi:hypothetical protein
MVYAKDSSKLDVNNPSQIVDKIAFKEKRIASASLSKSLLEKYCAISLIITEMKVRQFF